MKHDKPNAPTDAAWRRPLVVSTYAAAENGRKNAPAFACLGTSLTVKVPVVN